MQRIVSRNFFFESTQLISRFLDILFGGEDEENDCNVTITPSKINVSLFSIFDRKAKLFPSNFLTKIFRQRCAHLPMCRSQ